MLKIPYGISNFEQLREGNHLYIDKTKYIEILENDMPFQFIIRPRRFGKSLFISMMDSYYNVIKKDKFESLFGDLYIGKNPTPKRNSYLVLRLSFAGIVTNQGKERLIQSFDYSVVSKVDSFLFNYQNLLKLEENESYDKNAESAIKFIIEKAANSGNKIFIFIDEYDNFANELVGCKNKELYYDLITADGYIKAFYKTIKEGTGICIERVFMTGVSPIMLDDLTSGFNITTNLTLEENYNEMMGITKSELDEILQKYNIKDENIKRDLKYYYNGYLFNVSACERLYNTDMILYFLQNYISYGKYPRNILDNNVKTDYRKLRELALGFRDDETLNLLMNEEEIETEIVDRFSLENMFCDKENFISLLYYMGMLTIKESKWRNAILRIPNYVIKSIYWEYFLSKIKETMEINRIELGKCIESMRINGSIEEFIEYVKKVLEVLSNRDLQRFDEKYIKVLILTLIMVDGIYVADSEYESNGYIDLLLFGNSEYKEFVKYEWIIELKYLKESKRADLEVERNKAVLQLEKYAKSPKVTSRLGDKIKKVVLTFVGKNDVYADEI